MKTKHTQGKWFIGLERAENEFGVEGIDISCDNITALATVWNPDSDREDGDENEANAKLITAAPEILEALNNLIFTTTKLWDESKPIKDTEAMTVTHPIIEQAKEAIKKATE